MTDESSTERRTQPRVRPADRVKVRIFLPGCLAEGELRDLNHTGVFIATDLDLEEGTVVSLEIEIPGELDTKALPAIVARRVTSPMGARNDASKGLGLKFVVEAERDRALIQQVVTTLVALDLLGQDSDKKTAPKPADTVAYGRPFYRPDSEPQS